MQFLSIKNVHTMHFLSVFKLLFEEKRGEIFGDQCLLSGDQKSSTCSPVGAHIKKLILDPGITAWDTVPMI